MLKFDDFYHIPQLDASIAALVAAPRGVILVTGLDPRALTQGSDLLPSGRLTVFRALVGMLLEVPQRKAVVVADSREAVRVPRSLQQRVRTLLVRGAQGYSELLEQAVAQQPDLLVVDRLDAGNTAAVFHAAQHGLCVVAQLDTVCRGADVWQHLADLGVARAQSGLLSAVVAVERLARLCPHCRQPIVPDTQQAARIVELVGEAAAAPVFVAGPGCVHCEFRGRQGDVAVFDVYRAGANGATVLARETYLWQLVRAGVLALDDLLAHDAAQLYRTYHLLSHQTQALAEANSALQRKLLELESAHQVLQQRTAALRSLQDIGQALTRSTDLPDLARRVCQHAGELCGADRVVLYLTQPEVLAEILAVYGWEPELLHARAQLGIADEGTPAPYPFQGWPPGIPTLHADVAGFVLRAGLRVALVAEGQVLGHMIIQSTQKARFAPAEVVLVSAFADQAALAIQRAELLDARLRQERLEHELTLARQVQQSVLPRVFPQLPGYTFAARNQPARAVGGDLYDVFWLDDDHIGIVIADVSGKSMPAALYMALTRSLLLAEARREHSPRAVLLSVNQLLRELGDPQMFVTVFYGVLACTTRELTFARAGHDYPLLLRQGSATRLEGQGIVLGCFDSSEMRLSEERVQLHQGDRLALYTDGLTDVFAPDGQRFELERLTEVFLRYADGPPEALCTATFAALAAYQGDAAQFDDMTLLVVGIT